MWQPSRGRRGGARRGWRSLALSAGCRAAGDRRRVSAGRCRPPRRAWHRSRRESRGARARPASCGRRGARAAGLRPRSPPCPAPARPARSPPPAGGIPRSAAAPWQAGRACSRGARPRGRRRGATPGHRSPCLRSSRGRPVRWPARSRPASRRTTAASTQAFRRGSRRVSRRARGPTWSSPISPTVWPWGPCWPPALSPRAPPCGPQTTTARSCRSAAACRGPSPVRRGCRHLSSR